MTRRNSGIVPVREPNGRLSRASQEDVAAVSPGVVKRLRDAALRGAADAEWGTELGRLFLTGTLPAELYEAGKRWGRLVTAYHKAIGASPPYAKPQTFERYESSADPDDGSAEGQKRLQHDRAIIEDMREAHAVLIGAGLLAERAVRAVCEANESAVGAVGSAALDRGLYWLASHWQLTQASRKPNVRSA